MCSDSIVDSTNTNLNSAWMGMGLRSEFDESTMVGVCVNFALLDDHRQNGIFFCDVTISHSYTIHTFYFPSEPIRPGECAAIEEGAVGICAENCNSDSDCPDAGHKCCYNGCGHDCAPAKHDGKISVRGIFCVLNP